jgi:hypothetical protein
VTSRLANPGRLSGAPLLCILAVALATGVPSRVHAVADPPPASVVRFAPLPAEQAGYVGAFPEIYVEGAIAETTFTQLRHIVDGHGLVAARVQFNSRGGDLLTALEIGYYLREKGFVTEVGAFNGGWGRFAPGECHSACALAYLGGKYRLMDAGSRLAVHRFATDHAPGAAEPARVEQETQALAGLVVGYLQQMGVDLALFRKMSERPHEDLQYFGLDELRRLNVVNDGRMAPAWGLVIQDREAVLVGTQERIGNSGRVTLRCAAPVEVVYETDGFAEAWTEAMRAGGLQWVVGDEPFDVSPGMLAGSESTATGHFRVAVRMNGSQAERLAEARAIGLAAWQDGRRYEFRVDAGADPDVIRRYIEFCSAHAAAH